MWYTPLASLQWGGSTCPIQVFVRLTVPRKGPFATAQQPFREQSWNNPTLYSYHTTYEHSILCCNQDNKTTHRSGETNVRAEFLQKNASEGRTQRKWRLWGEISSRSSHKRVDRRLYSIIHTHVHKISFEKCHNRPRRCVILQILIV